MGLCGVPCAQMTVGGLVRGTPRARGAFPPDGDYHERVSERLERSEQLPEDGRVLFAHDGGTLHIVAGEGRVWTLTRSGRSVELHELESGLFRIDDGERVTGPLTWQQVIAAHLP